MMSSRSAFALSLVLWIVAALLLGVALLVSFSKDTLEITKGVKEKLTTRLKAESALEELKYYLVTGKPDNTGISNNLSAFPKKIVLDGRVYKTGNIEFSITDLSAKMNIFHPSPDLIASVAADNKRELLYTMRDSLKDWVDKDNVVSLGGAERAYYKLQAERNYTPRNSPAIQSLDELWLIKGFDTLSAKKRNQLKQYFRDVTTGSNINLLLIKPLYLAKLLHFNSNEVESLVKLRKTDLQKFMAIVQKNKYFDDDYMRSVLSYKVEISLSVHTKYATTKLHTVIDLKDKNTIRTYRYEIF